MSESALDRILNHVDMQSDWWFEGDAELAALRARVAELEEQAVSEALPESCDVCKHFNKCKHQNGIDYAYGGLECTAIRSNSALRPRVCDCKCGELVITYYFNDAKIDRETIRAVHAAHEIGVTLRALMEAEAKKLTEAVK